MNQPRMRDADMPLLDRIDAAIKRVTSGQGQMRMPVEATDPDVVLGDAKTEIESAWNHIDFMGEVNRGLTAAATEAGRLCEHLLARNTALYLAVSDMTEVMGRMASGLNHMDKLAREWEPDHSTGFDRAGWARANEAVQDAERVLQGVRDVLAKNIDPETGAPTQPTGDAPCASN